MVHYTTGEMAKLCGVSVRTVQYYDTRHILSPSTLSEGGRRLYSEEDLRRMRLVCFLRDMGFSLDHIGKLMADDQPEKVIVLLIEQQERLLTDELQKQQAKLAMLTDMKRALRNVDSISLESLGDIAYVVKNRKKRRRLIVGMSIMGALMDMIEIATVVYGMKTGTWWPLAVGLPVVVGLGVFISYYYFHHVDYICPACHTCFHPKLRQALWSSHTPNTRRLTCPHCGHRGFCVETYAGKDDKPSGQDPLP